MIGIGYNFNGYIVQAVMAQYRGTDEVKGVVFLAFNASRTSDCYVVSEVDTEDAPSEWRSGNYSSSPDTAMHRFLQRSNAADLAGLIDPPEPTPHWAIVEVQDGSADIDTNVSYLIVDWDNMVDNWEYGDNVLTEIERDTTLADKAGNIQTRLREMFPTEYAERMEGK